MKKLTRLVDGTGAIALHLNKGQYGASDWAVQELDKTAMQPSVKDSIGLLITGAALSHYR